MASYILWVVGALTAGVLNIFSPIARSDTGEELASLLSKGAEIYLPTSIGFKNATARWNAGTKPGIDIVVKVKTEQDVQNAIRYANNHKKPFLAISGAHGQTSTLNNIQNGLGIWMRGMTGIKIEGHIANLGGGIENGEVIRELWSAGKQTSTTACDCAGFVAPVLGGGHGWLQGRYGLPADQLISARLVLGNGTAITVSEYDHKDLFWAIRGAGHNYGIVTELEIKVYDREPEQDQWATAAFTFRHDQLEAVFAIGNQWLTNATRPIELTHYGTIALDLAIDPIMPVFTFYVFWQGQSIPAIYTDPFYALKPVNIVRKVTDLVGMNTHLAAGYGMAVCEKGYSHLLYPVSLDTWPIANLRKVLELFSSLPPEFRNSAMLLEAYATNRVNEIHADSTAFADRSSQLLLSPVLTYAPNSSLDNAAFSIGENIRKTLIEGTGKRLITYVNYAHGDESLESIYGYDSWRLEKLKRLKREYDPEGRFNFYSPIK